jgi:hypothetical protein
VALVQFQEAVHDFSKHPERIPDVLDFHKWLSHPLSIPVSRVRPPLFRSIDRNT